MADKKTILVFGATGIQGASVVNAILRDSKLAAEWHIRGVTRDVTKPSSKALVEKGVELVTADLDDKVSLKKAMEGCYSVFLVTNYWEKMSKEVEVTQGKSAADVAKDVGVEHFILSSLMDINKISGGKFKHVLHFDGKAEIGEYATSIGLPVTQFQPGVYMSNFTPAQSLRINPQTGLYTLAFPIPTDKPVIPLIDAAADTGKFVTGIMRNRSTLIGKKVYAATKYYSLNEMIEDFSEVKPESGKGAVAIQVPDEMFKGFLGKAGLPEIAHQEMLENFLMLNDCGYYNGADLTESQSIVTERLTTWKEYVANDKAFIDLK